MPFEVQVAKLGGRRPKFGSFEPGTEQKISLNAIVGVSLRDRAGRVVFGEPLAAVTPHKADVKGLVQEK